MSTLAEDFMRFLQEYGVIGLAIAVVIGTASKELVNAVVDDLMMPIVEVLLPGGNWRAVTTAVGPVEFQTGHLIGAVLDFTLIAFMVYLFVRYALRQDEVKKL